MYSHILVPTDGSPVSARAEKAAIELARKHKARMTIVHVISPYSPPAVGEIRGLGPDPLSAEEYRKASEKRGNAILKKVAARAALARVKADVELIASDAPGAALLKAAKAKRCDVIVMGTSNRVGIERFFLGSVATEVLENSPNPVIVYR